MKLNKTVLTDFGPYRGRNEFDLHTTPEKPMILFGGKNGAGKTTFFQAVQLCLHGQSALGRRASRGEYEKTIHDLLHDGPNEKAGSAAVRLEFDYGRLGEQDSYSIERCWRDRGQSIIEDLTIERNGEKLSDIEESQWEDFLKELIPPGVSQLFFFDGEKVQELATAIEEDGGFENALLSLLGLDLVEQLDSDLSFYLSNKLDTGDDDELQAEIKELGDKKTEKEGKLHEVEYEIAETGDKLAKIRRAISQKEEVLAQEGGAFARQRSEFQEERAALNTKIEQIEENIRDVLKSAYPFTLVPDLCRNVEDRLREETKARDLASTRDELLSEVANLAEHPDELDLVDTNDETTQQVLARLHGVLDDRLDADAELLLADSFSEKQRRHMYSIVDTALNGVPADLGDYTKRLKDQQRRLETVEEQLSRAPDENTVAPLIGEINDLSERRGRLTEQVDSLEDNREDLKKRVTWLETERDRKLGKRTKLDDVSERAKLARSAQEAIQDYQEQLAKRKLERLEEALTESYLTLSNKSQFYERVAIDKDSLTITIGTANGDSKRQSQLSAGERQIFATALLWALAEISEHPLPFIIDTPLGRLDQDHRENLVKNFFPKAAHQVIVLSTDTEITDDHYTHLTRHTSSEYHLEYNEDSGYTEVSRGYFAHEAVDENTPQNAYADDPPMESNTTLTTGGENDE